MVDQALVEKLAHALQMLGLKRSLVVHGSDGLDEITITGPTKIAELRDGRVRVYDVTPAAQGTFNVRVGDRVVELGERELRSFQRLASWLPTEISSEGLRVQVLFLGSLGFRPRFAEASMAL